MTSSGAQQRASSASLTDRWPDALADVQPNDRVLWCLGATPLPSLLAPVVDARDLSHAQRLRALREQETTVLVTTPTDALRLVEEAARSHSDLAESSVRLVVVSGEPGGSVPSTRSRIEERFAARCRDVYTLGDVGPVGWQCSVLERGVHVYLPFEVTDGELLLRNGDRSGDAALLTDSPACVCGRPTVVVLGRAEDALTVRGVAIFPSTIENIVRRHPAVNEYRLEAYHVRGECELAIDVEPDEAVATEGDRARVAAEVAEDVRRSLGLRLQCEAVPASSLPRDDPRPRRLVWRS